MLGDTLVKDVFAIKALTAWVKRKPFCFLEEKNR
jgi:hypothetical protein